MDVMTAIRERRSIRAYQERDVEKDKLERILEAGRLAPSARNFQEWKFVVVRDPELRRALAEAADAQRFVGEAPVVIVACATETHYTMPCGLPSYQIDVAIALTHMTLQATAEGLGACWIGAFKTDEVKRLLGIPEEVGVVELLPLGYPMHHPPPKSRKALSEIVSYNRWE